MSNAFRRHDGELHAEGLPLAKIAEAYGTPSYVYSRAALAEGYRAFDLALSPHPHRVCYAVKANGNLAVLNALARLGAGFDIVSRGELERVLRAGGDAGRVVFSGVGKSPEEMRAGLEAGIHSFNVESLSELVTLSEIAAALGTRAPVAVRVNPDVDPRTHPYVSTGLAQHKFGIPMSQAPEVYARAMALPGIQIVGLACHIGSQILALDAFELAALRMAELAQRLESEGIALAHVDLGGGLGLGYGRADTPDPAAYARALLGPFATSRYEILIEPGRGIVGPAGVLLCRLLYLKETPAKRFAIVDAGMNDLLRPALYGAWQQIVAVRERPELEPSICDVVGPVCESADFIGLERELRAEPGDLLAVLDAGAYGFSMSSQYNARPRPPELMVDGSQLHVARARETLDDLMSGEAILP